MDVRIRRWGLWMFLCAVWLAAATGCQLPAALAEDAIQASKASVAAWEYRFSPEDEAFLNEIEHGCFQYLWKEVGSPAKLAKDKTSDTICSTAAVGFQLSSLM